MYECEKCKRKYKLLACYKKHIEKCKNKIISIIELNNNENILCSYGCGLIAKFQLKNNKYCCSHTICKCPKIKEKNSLKLKQISEYNKSNNIIRHRFFTKTKANKGKTQLELFGKEKTLDINNRISASLKENYKKGIRKFDKNNENTRREKIRKSINKRYEDGWMPKAGRCKKIRYNSKICGDVLLDGTWELKVAEFFDKNNINWNRNKKRFKYIFNNKERFYTPDFYLVDTNEYLEVKGYETELDHAKWNQFTEKIIIWKKKELKNLNII